MGGKPALVAIVGSSLLVSACGGGERQDKNEPNRTYKLSITDASFPAKQRLADKTTMKITVKNDDSATAPNVAVTVATDAARVDGKANGSPQAFSQDISDPSVSDPSRPIWIVDAPPKGGVTAYTNTWALGPLKAGQSKTFEWHVTAVKAGDYKIKYSASPGLTGKSKPAGDTKGSFAVNVTRTPPQSRVNGKGQVVTLPDDQN